MEKIDRQMKKSISEPILTSGFDFLDKIIHSFDNEITGFDKNIGKSDENLNTNNAPSNKQTNGYGVNL